MESSSREQPNTLSSDEAQELIEELEKDGLVERTGATRDGHPVYRATDAGQSEWARQRWEAIEHPEVLALLHLVLAADGQTLHDPSGNTPPAPPSEIIRDLADELGEVASQRGLVERAAIAPTQDS